MSDQFFWFSARASGMMSWQAAALSVLVGFLMGSRLLGRKPTIPWLLDLHRFFAAMSFVFLGIHLVSLWFDDFINFSIADLLIPGRAELAGQPPRALLWGGFAMWIMIVVQSTSLIKKRLPKQFWHTVHLTSLVSLLMGLIHGIQVGSDNGEPWLVALQASLMLALVLVGGVRLARVITNSRPEVEPEPAVEMIAASVGNELGRAQPTANLALLGSGGGRQPHHGNTQGRQAPNHQDPAFGGGVHQPMIPIGGRRPKPAGQQPDMGYGYGYPDQSYGSDQAVGFDPVTVAPGEIGIAQNNLGHNGVDDSGAGPVVGGYPDYGRYGAGDAYSQPARGQRDVNIPDRTMPIPQRQKQARRRTVKDALADYTDRPKDIPAPLPRHRRTH